MTISIRSGSALSKTGLVVAGYPGQVVAHPLVAEIRKCLSIPGISPTDRARLGLAEVKKETALQEFIAISRKNAQG
jgi:hypothetical protein